MSSLVSRLQGAFASLCLAVSLIGCGGSGSDTAPADPPAPTGQISGQVLDAAQAAPLANARISAAGNTATTDAQGRFTLASLSPANAVVLRIEADGHLAAVLTLPVTADQTTPVVHRLSAAGSAQTFNAAAPATLRAPGTLASVDLPANGLVVDGGSTAATGTLTARVTVIDPVRDPAAMPGRYVATTGRAIQSFGAINVDLRDAAGQKLNLKAGSTATLRIPLATRSPEAPATVPLFYFDEKLGLWKQEGEATLKTTTEGSWYEGSVSHFTTWNADMEMDTIFVNGCVNDAAGKAVPQAVVNSTGVNYSGMDFTSTDSAGKFRVAIRRGSVAEVRAMMALETSAPVTVGPSDVDITLPACLVLEAAAKPTITSGPADVSAVEGQRVYFSCSARGGQLRYRWLRDGVALVGETFSTLTLTARTADHGARFVCEASNALGSATSAAATLSVTAATAPVIVTPPASVARTVGTTAVFTAEVLGSGPLSLQWQRNGVDIAGATTTSYTTPALTLADHGARFRLVARNAYGSATSAEATLSVTEVVLAAPTITGQPAPATVLQGQTATFTVQATGSPAPTYQWRRNAVPITGATSASYTTPTLGTADSGAVYSVSVSNSQGSVVSAGALLTVQAGNSGSDDEREQLLRLLGTGGVWLQAVSAPMAVINEQGVVQSSAATCSSGAVTATLNGTAAPVGQPLPATGVLAASFNNCVNEFQRYNGSASVNYNFTSLGDGTTTPTNGSLTATVNGLRIADTNGGTDDYTVDGGAQATLTGTLAGGTLTQGIDIAPMANTSITNNRLNLRAVLTGGSLSVTSSTRVSDDRLLSSAMSYTNYGFTVGTTPYLVTGSIQTNFGNADGSFPTGTGEIVLTSNGTTVGRLFFLNGVLQIEVNGRLEPFAAGGARQAQAAPGRGTPRTPRIAGR